MKTYSECIKLPTFEERFGYLKIPGIVSEMTFGGNRYLNQQFYASPEWKTARRDAIARDLGCDLADPDRPIRTKIYIHHIEPITIEDVVKRRSNVFDLENLICVSFNTHNAIHYGNKDLLTPSKPIERKPNDQAPWRKEV